MIFDGESQPAEAPSRLAFRDIVLIHLRFFMCGLGGAALFPWDLHGPDGRFLGIFGPASPEFPCGAIP